MNGDGWFRDIRYALHQLARAPAIGLVLALGAGRAAQAFLGDVSFADPVALVAGPLVMIACALVASWLPARRAARIDPMKALREE